MERGVQLTDKGDDWNKAFAFYQGIDEDKAVEDSAAALELSAKPHRVQRTRRRRWILYGRQSRVPVVSAIQTRLRSWLLRRQHRENHSHEAKNLNSPLMLHIAGDDKFCPPEAQRQIHDSS